MAQGARGEEVHPGKRASVRVMAVLLLTLSGAGEGLASISVNLVEKKMQGGNFLSRPKQIVMARQPIVASSTMASFDYVLSSHPTGMYFGTANNTLVRCQTGSTGFLPCFIHNIGDGIVSWIRKKDYRLLTVGLTTYSSDQRYQAVHMQHSEDWSLQVKFVQKRDAGLYECQVSTHPPTSIFLRLQVVEAHAQISGPAEKYIKPGSSLRLQCLILRTTEVPAYIFWYHNDRMINFDMDRGVNVTVDPAARSSDLYIPYAKTIHTGNYTCSPNNAQQASIYLHIFNGENPAAMQSGSTCLWLCCSTSFFVIILGNIFLNACR